MSVPLSLKTRMEAKKALRETVSDLIVVGGGITGAGIALDARSRGMETVLVEMQDFAAGTSSRSTKLVHGGLRYLQQWEFMMVAKTGRERTVVYENAPHVTMPIRMMLPVLKEGKLGRRTIAAALALYDRLAAVPAEFRHRMLGVEEAAAREPLLGNPRLRGAGWYVEFRTDDARLTLEVVKKAAEMGARVFNYMKAEKLLTEGNRLVGIRVRDLLTGETEDWKARKVVNATGPWPGILRAADGNLAGGKRLHLTKGVHLVMDRRRFPLRHAVYFEGPDGRMVFAIPRGEKTYAGTTDTDYHGDPAAPRTTAEDRDYLLDALSHLFPNLCLSPDDVEACWAGIRPLVHEEGKAPSEISRKDEIVEFPSGLVCIAGGKLTGYRWMAEKVTDLLARRLKRETGREFGPCLTREIRLSGGIEGGSSAFPKFLGEKIRCGMAVGLGREQSEELARRYGANVDEVFRFIDHGRREADEYGLPPDLYGSLCYGLEREMVIRPDDFFVRRISALPFDVGRVLRRKEAVVRMMGDRFGWDPYRRSEAERILETAVREYTEILP